MWLFICVWYDNIIIWKSSWFLGVPIFVSTSRAKSQSQTRTDFLMINQGGFERSIYLTLCRLPLLLWDLPESIVKQTIAFFANKSCLTLSANVIISTLDPCLYVDKTSMSDSWRFANHVVLEKMMSCDSSLPLSNFHFMIIASCIFLVATLILVVSIFIKHYASEGI